MKKLLLFFATFLLLSGIKAQSVGDTIIVQAYDYSTTTRDQVVSFPNNPNQTYERVIMRYAMRCKGALVSTSSNRNLGCGEWDYSCNTYIHNPDLADSVAQTTQKYTITPSTNPNSIYSNTPTYSISPKLQTKVILNGITQEDTASIGTGTIADTNFIKSANNGKSFMIISSSELTSEGLTMGSIDALSFNSLSSGNIKVKEFRVKLKQTNLVNVDIVDTAVLNNLQEVYHHDYTFNLGENRIQFNTPFTWDGSSNILVQLSYDGINSNQALSLSSNSGANSIVANADLSGNFFPSNYIVADSYLGISGSNSRTVEAWIKTTGRGEIATWGTNAQGQKQSFWINNNGQLRLEINSAYAVGTATVDDGNWHHVAFTFSGSSMYDVRFYIDGKWDYSSSVQTRPMNTGSSKLFEISKGFHNRYFTGEIDDIRVWSSALSLNTIKDWMHRKIDTSGNVSANTHPNLANLELAYELNGSGNRISDISGNQNHAEFESVPNYKSIIGDEMIKNFNSYSTRPNVKLYQGTYNLTIGADTILDTLVNDPFFVTERTIYPRVGTTQSDSIGTTLNSYYPENTVIYDLAGNVVSSAASSSTSNLQQVTLNYFQRNPSKVEIMSFVTPYGIGLDLGTDGEAWYFDVTDFLPVLKGNRRMTLERGGQNQEEMDIQFYFIIGTPMAEVKSIQQIWKVDQRNYSDINSNRFFAPRTVHVDTSASNFKLRSAITGHGQQGEFIARNHTITINSGAIVFNNLVWKECADNPVFPQGGTWIYDRAGWCPGMATDIDEYDLTTYVTGDSITVDYNVNGAVGDSRYIVSEQLVSYGSANFQNDAKLVTVIRPTNQIEFGRINPMCYNPIITIQNTGSNTLTSATIEYSVNGSSPQTQTWTGNLVYMDETNVQLVIPQSFWTAALPGTNTFTARITSVNGGADQYVHNNTFNSKFELVDDLPSNLNIVIRTNSNGNHSSYTLRNSSGATVLSRSSLGNNQTYTNSINLPTGCYQLRLFDTGDDGLSFWANSAGSGYFRITQQNGTIIKTFEPDFGGGHEYYFTVGRTTGLNEAEEFSQLEVFPNPARNQLTVIYENITGTYELVNSIGQIVLNGDLNNNNNLMHLDVTDIEKGIYFLKINSEKNSTIKKIIIQ